jgi:nicotinamide-nucleotide amidase
MHAAILSIGDELTLGQSIDTNSAYLSEKLVARGILPILHLTVPDDLPLICQAFALAAEKAQLVIATGGLGPTDDDLTRQALASLLHVPLELHAPSLQQIEAFFAARNRPMADRNRIQAMIPRSATALDNPFGTAPAIRCTIASATVFCLPGVPTEMKGLFDRHISPHLDQLAAETSPAASQNGRFILTRKINTFGQGESNVAQLLGDLMARNRNPTVGTTVANSIVAIRIRSDFPTLAQARQQLDDTLAACHACLGPIVFGHDDESLAQAVLTDLAARHQTLATAESCTGGLLAQMITDVPGSSAAFLGGWVTYANDMKQRELAVDPALLLQHGAVSQPVARAMASGARQRSGADFALAITGIAGPTGGTPEKPVGLVWIALATPHGISTAEPFNLPGDRSSIRDRAAKAALNMLRLHLRSSAQ